MRRVTRTTGTAILISFTMLAATALSGCWGAGSPAWVSASGPVPPGLSGARAWSTRVTWSRDGLVETGIPATLSGGDGYASAPGFGLVAVAGDVIVTATYGDRTQDGHTPVTLQFHNAKTGDVLASKTIQASLFGGIRADTLGGKPVVEVRDSPSRADLDDDSFVSTVFDTSARELWTSAGQQVYHWPSVPGGLMSLPETGGRLSHGYLMRLNAGKGEYHDGASYDVLDTTGKVIMNVPYHQYFDPAHPTKVNSVNFLELIDRYAVVMHGDTAPTAKVTLPAEVGFRFVVYDLDQGGKKVAEAPESMPMVQDNVRIGYRVVAACGSKLVLQWETGSMDRPSESAIRIAVLDLGSGHTTPPVAVMAPLRVNLPPPLRALYDSTCSTMVIYGGVPAPAVFAINLAHGTLLWRRDLRYQYRYLSMLNGVVYAMESQPTPAPPPPGRLFSISAADGSTVGGDLAVAPLAVTADGSPIFAEKAEPSVCEPLPSPTASSASRPARPANCDVTVWVGRASR